ncbi:PEP-CTERM sorting domain-containing protein [Vitreoscilla filiformis]|jgi:hypothetical protein|uniref:PEP-CTERM sorting domain-containing protein n=1 Tax=Vitreoscilla filiformis TaxID=63 RepID=UPI000B7A96B3|nr:PEP-CTERM sorting domain-containing protein [Vitreoscilla filiformis]
MSTTFSLVSRGLLGLAGMGLAALAFSAQAANSVPYPERETELDTSYTLPHTGDTLAFGLKNNTLHQDLYFDATRSATYDRFEDPRFPHSADNDLSFVFTNVSVAMNGAASPVPEPQSLAMLVAGLAAVVGATVRRRRAESMGDQARA